jgi:hypothetical protein
VTDKIRSDFFSLKFIRKNEAQRERERERMYRANMFIFQSGREKRISLEANSL